MLLMTHLFPMKVRQTTKSRPKKQRTKEILMEKGIWKKMPLEGRKEKNEFLPKRKANTDASINKLINWVNLTLFGMIRTFISLKLLMRTRQGQVLIRFPCSP